MTDKEKIQLFSEMIDTLISCPSLFEEHARSICKFVDNIYAISGDMDNNVCDELNVYYDEGSFTGCRRMTSTSSTVWEFAFTKELTFIIIPDKYIEEDINITDLYVTKDMEGFDFIIYKLKTAAQAYIL